MNDRVIEVESLSLVLDGRSILRDVTFAVGHGEYVSVIGPNGAGKSTLLKCLNGIQGHATGTIRLRGRDIRSYHQRDLAKLMSYVPQSDGRLFPYTVREFVTMGRYPYLSPFTSVSDTDHRAVEEAILLVGAQDLADRHLMTLSGGERQKVLIAAALAQGAGIMLLDEPTTFLDYRHQTEIQRILRRINHEPQNGSSGVTILSVTHDINSAVMTSSRVVALKNGTIVFAGPPVDLMTDHMLENIYDTRFFFVAHPVTGETVIVPESVRSTGNAT